jgi:outer membrane protein assembly factor BamA
MYGLFRNVVILTAAVFFSSFILLFAEDEKKNTEKQGLDDHRDNFEDNFGIVPIAIPFYTPETSVGLGAGLVMFNYADGDRSLRPDGLELEVFGTIKKQFEGKLCGDKYFSRNAFRFTGELEAKIFPNNFYGAGPDVKKKDKEEYDQNSIAFESGFLFRIIKNLYFGPYGEFSYYKVTNTESDGLLAQELYNGSDGTTATGLGAYADYDSRDHEFYPKKGLLASTKFLSYRKALGSEYNFTETEFDIKQFFHITGEHVIGVEGFLSNSAGDVPWQKLGELGGQFLMRGYEEGKFRDKSYAAAQAEYRFPLFWRLTGTAFGSAGTVADKINKFESDNMKYSFGLGLRCILDKDEHIPLRLDLAMNKDFDEPSIYFGLLEAF